MERAISETARRREKQIGFNQAHGIVPRGVVKQVRELIDGVYDLSGDEARATAAPPSGKAVAPGEQAIQRSAERLQGLDLDNEAQVSKEIRKLEKQMATHARNLDFEKAARVRDELAALRQLLFGAGGKA